MNKSSGSTDSRNSSVHTSHPFWDCKSVYVSLYSSVHPIQNFWSETQFSTESRVALPSNIDHSRWEWHLHQTIVFKAFIWCYCFEHHKRAIIIYKFTKKESCLYNWIGSLCFFVCILIFKIVYFTNEYILSWTWYTTLLLLLLFFWESKEIFSSSCSFSCSFPI